MQTLTLDNIQKHRQNGGNPNDMQSTEWGDSARDNTGENKDKGHDYPVCKYQGIILHYRKIPWQNSR